MNSTVTLCYYTDFAIKTQSIKYLNRSKDFIMASLGLQQDSLKHHLIILNLIRKFSNCQTSDVVQDFAEKFLPTI
jgi:hypothetical protein